MSRQRRKSHEPSLETLESRQLLSLARQPALTLRALHLQAARRAFHDQLTTPRPDLDDFARQLAHHPRQATRAGLGALARDLDRHVGFAVRHGWGTCLAMELITHPAYATSHHLTGLLVPPSIPFPTGAVAVDTTATPTPASQVIEKLVGPPTPSTPSPTDAATLPSATEEPTPWLPAFDPTIAVGGTLDVTVPNGGLSGPDLTFTITPQPLPAGMTFNRGTGELTFAPAPDQVGTYPFTVEVSDGVRAFRESVPITVSAPPLATTEVSGQVVDEAGRPLEGIPVTIGSAVATTDAKGNFTLVDVPANSGPLSAGGAVADAQDRQGLMAPVAQLLGHPVYEDADNVMPEPLILPRIPWSTPARFGPMNASERRGLDLTNPAMPGFDIHLEPDVARTAATGGALEVAELSPELAAQHMPEGLGGGMLVYRAVGVDLTQPARLSLPNTNGFQPGAVVELLTMNLTTGGHDAVGRMVVSDDGRTMTSTGPIVLAHAPADALAAEATTLGSGDGDVKTLYQYSGCLFVGPWGPTGQQTGPCGCQPGGNAVGANNPPDNPFLTGGPRMLASDVGLTTGEYFQDHATAGYQSLGQVRGLDLQYNSGQANPKPVVQFQFTTPPAGDAAAITSVTAQVSLGGVVQGVPTTYPTPGGLADETTYNVPLQVDATALAEGVYPYVMTVTEHFGSTTTITTDFQGTVDVVNNADSPLGAGWSVGGAQRIAQAAPGQSVFITAGQQVPERFNLIYNDGQTAYQDLAVATGAASAVVLANDGDGRFPDATLGNGATAGIAAADFNGDDRPDLAVAGASTLAIRLNNGSGGLGTATNLSLPTGRRARGLVVGDFSGHGNGILDLAVLLGPSSGSGDYSVALYVGVGDGTFASPVLGTVGVGVASGSQPDSLAAADFNGDGQTDLVFTTDDGLVAVLLAASGGTFTTATSPSLPSGHTALGVTTADVDADGKTDLIVEVANANVQEDGYPFVALDLFTGSGTGGFSFTSTHQTAGQPDHATLGLVAGAFQGDDVGLEVAVPVTNGGGGITYLEIVTLSSAGVWGHGTLHAVGPDSSTQPGNIVAADLNGTGRPSIALTDGSGQIEILRTDLESNQFLPVGHAALSSGWGAMLAVAPFAGHAAAPRFRGHTSNPSTLVHNLDGTWTRSYPDGTVLQFDASGRETSETDRNGNATTYAHVPAGQPAAGALRTVTDPVGLVTTLAYNASGHLSTITDPASRVTTLSIDSHGNLTQIVDPDGAVTQYGYATPANHRITTEINPNGHTATAHYDGFGLLTSETLFDGTSTVTVQPALSRGLLAPGGSGSLATGYQAGLTDPNGHATTIGLTWMGHVDGQTDPNGATSHTTYDSRGFPATSTDPLGRVTSYTHDDNGNLTSITLPSDDPGGAGGPGPTETIAYDDPFGVPTAITDFNGHTTTFTLDAHGNVLRRTDPDGLHEDWTHDSAGLVLTDTDRGGHATTYQYDTYGRPVRIDNPDGAADPVNVAVGGATTASAQNAPSEGVAQAFDQDPATKWLAFAGTGWIQEQFPAGRAYQVTQYQLTSAADTGLYPGRAPRNWQLQGSNNGASWTVLDTRTNQADTTSSDTRTYTVASPGSYEYYRLNITANNGDGATQLADLKLLAVPASAPSLAASHQGFTYDTAGNLTSVTDELGRTTTLTYDPMGRLLSTRDPIQAAAGQQTTYAYDDDGNLVSVTDALGHVTSYAYDARDRRIAMTDPVHQGTSLHTAYGYDDAGNLTSVTDPLGHATTYGHDANNRLATVTDPLNHVTTYAYDLAGELTSITDPNGAPTRFGYDVRGRLQEVLGPYDMTGDGSGVYDTEQVAWYAYDANGNLTAATDANYHVTHYAHDALDRVIAVTDPLGHVTRFGYDVDGRQTSVLDPLGHATLDFFDARGRLFAETAPAGGGTTRFTYDDASRLTSLTDPVGNTTAWAYDAAGRVATEVDPLGHLTTYAYDLVGNLAQKIDRDDRAIQYAYDANDRPTTETWVGASPAQTITTTYDDAGRVTGTGDAFSAYSFAYDAADHRTGVDNLGTPGMPHVVLTAAYDAAGNRTSLSDSQGGVTSYTYDPRNQIIGVAQSGTGVTARQVGVSRDNAGRVVGLYRYRLQGGFQLVLSTTSTHDNAGRLTGLTHKAAGGTVRAAYAYTLDADDRSTQETRTWNSGAATDTVGYTYTDDDQLTGVTHTNGSFAAESFSYDANGNRTMSGYTTSAGNRLTSDGVYTYAYDDEGNLTTRTEIASGDQTLYAYDYRDRLVEVDSQPSGGSATVLAKYTYDALDRRIKLVEGGATTWTVYDGMLPILDFDGSGAQTARYLNGPSAAGVDAVLARETPAGGVAWYLPDRLGTVRDLVDNAGALIDHLDHGAFGAELGETNPGVGGRLAGYAGMQTDATTGLYFDQARWYDPQSGRFISLDPKTFAAGDANLYRYVGNGPTNALDPTGLASKEIKPGNWPKAIKEIAKAKEILGRYRRTFFIDRICEVREDSPHDGAGKKWPRHYEVYFIDDDGEFQKIQGIINDDGKWEPIEPDDLPDTTEKVGWGEWVWGGVESGAEWTWGGIKSGAEWAYGHPIETTTGAVIVVITVAQPELIPITGATCGRLVGAY